MNLHALRIFHEVAKYNSVSLAAEKLFISQPAVSQQIKKLEETHQVKLIMPEGRGIVLTDMGKEVFAKSQLLFAQEEVIEKLLSTKNAGQTIRIGGTQLTIEQIIKRKIMEKQNDPLNLQFTTLNTEKIIDLLKVEALDFAFLPKKIELPNYERSLLYQDQWVFVASSEYPVNRLSLEEVYLLPIILREKSSRTREQMMAILPKNHKFCYSIEVNSHHDAIQLTLNKQGIYFCSYLNVEKYLESNELKLVSIQDYQPVIRDTYMYQNLGTKNLNHVQTYTKRLKEILNREKQSNA